MTKFYWKNTSIAKNGTIFLLIRISQKIGHYKFPWIHIQDDNVVNSKYFFDWFRKKLSIIESVSLNNVTGILVGIYA